MANKNNDESGNSPPPSPVNDQPAPPETERLLQERKTNCSGDNFLNHKKIESAGASSVQDYRDLVENLNDVVFICDVTGRLSYVSAPFQQISGHLAEDIIGQPFAQLMHPDDLPALHRRFHEVLGGKLEPWEFRYLTKNGEIRWARTSSTPIIREQGVLGIRGILVDITAKKLAEEKLHAALQEAGDKNHEMSCLLQAARVVLSDKEFKKIIRHIFTLCSLAVGTLSGYVAIRNRKNRDFDILFSDGDRLAGIDLAALLQEMAVEEQLDKEKAFFVNDCTASTGPLLSPETKAPGASLLFAALTLSGRLQGILILADKEGGFTANDAQLAAAFAELMAIALRNARTQKTLDEHKQQLQKAHDTLEKRITKRTRDLTIVNRALHEEIQDRVAIEKSLVDSQERYRRITRTLTDCIYTVSLAKNLPLTISHSPRCESLSGYKQAEFIADRTLWLRIIDPPFRKAVTTFLQNFLSLKTTSSIEIAIIAKNGTRLWIRQTLVPYTDSQGNLIYYDGLIQDLTEIKRSEEQILQSKKRLQAVFDGIADPLIMVGKDLRIQMINRAAASYYNLPSLTQAIGTPFFTSLENPANQGPDQDIAKAAAGDKVINFTRERAVEPIRYESVTIFPLQAKEIANAGAIIRITDTTEAKMLEKNLMRTEKLASIGVLSAGIAHEINNPNNFIMFNTPVLRRYLEVMLPILQKHAADHADTTYFGMSYADFTNDLFELIDSIENGSERIEKIVADLKQFSCLEETNQTAWVNPQQSISQAIRLAQVHLKDTVKHLAVELAPELPAVHFTVGRLEQILVNLLINAAQAADKNDSRVIVRARVAGQTSQFLVIEVEDNGCGMAQKTVERIFDPFFTTKAPGIGTGLGLYVCHTLIDKEGGSLTATSRLGQGSIFTIRLQCA